MSAPAVGMGIPGGPRSQTTPFLPWTQLYCLFGWEGRSEVSTGALGEEGQPVQLAPVAPGPPDGPGGAWLPEASASESSTLSGIVPAWRAQPGPAAPASPSCLTQSSGCARPAVPEAACQGASPFSRALLWPSSGSLRLFHPRMRGKQLASIREEAR